MIYPIRKLGEVCDIKTGKKDVNEGNPNGKYPFFTCAREHTFSDSYSFDTEALLVAGNGDVGHVSYYNGKFEAYQRTYVLSNFKDILAPFLFRILDGTLKDTVSKQKLGNTMPYIKMGMLSEFEIPVPSLDEQREIIKTLDVLLGGVENVKTYTEKSLQNSIDIFDSYLSEILVEVREKSGEKKLGEVCNRVEYGTSAKSKKTGKTAVLRMGNIQNGRFNWDNLVYTDNKDEIKKYSLKYNDVLFNRTNSPELVGKTAIYKDEMPAIFAGYLIRIHRKEDLLDAEYLNYFLNSNLAKQYGRTVVISSVNQANINGQKLKSYPIPVPSLSEQKTIVKKLNLLSEKTEALQKIYKQKLIGLDELKGALLKKAFSGELTATKIDTTTTPPKVTMARPVTSVQEVVVSPYIRNQIHAAIIDQVERDGGWTTEVAVAKYDHLLQEVFGLPLGYQFQAQRFGPFDGQIKRLLSSGLGPNRWFTKSNGMIIFGSNVRGLLFRQSNLYRNAQSIMQELSHLGVTKLNADKLELLSTICHSIKEKASVTLNDIRAFMAQWPTDGNRTKAEKFSEEDTQKCLDFILRNNLHQRLLQTI